MKFVLVIGDRNNIVVKKDFKDQIAANEWFDTTFSIEEGHVQDYVLLNPIPTKKYKVAYNRISPSYSLVDASNEAEAKDKVNRALENEGCPSWEFLMVKEEK